MAQAREFSRAFAGGDLDPGEPPIEEVRSRRFGVSRTPVREALAKLD